jgi:hypothetical protein
MKAALIREHHGIPEASEVEDHWIAQQSQHFRGQKNVQENNSISLVRI